jgi:hypothetical protein
MILKDGDKPTLRAPDALLGHGRFRADSYLGEIVAFLTITPPEPCVKPNQRTSSAASRFGIQDVSILAAAVSTERSGSDPDIQIWDRCALASETAEM